MSRRYAWAVAIALAIAAVLAAESAGYFETAQTPGRPSPHAINQSQ
ncbi:hypothetical protein EV130_108296 [Rhizobium azibense]|uniref:Ti type entry exclusion protein TrbK n=1 Tax=Rhizobium azibense TaxID=1136135 RepID=A0A4R3RPW4_9HYPH|nr:MULTISPECIES: hypothetical protein [Rhizobium]TCU23151.1 hypothetical protein EV130_108296 [Rhizobium azibense]TCU36729.1 hypothetical protein EV129_107297 [Rhizobium azibense]